MPQGLQAFALMLVLLPGFLSARIVQMLCTRPKQTELEKIIEALIFSFVVYLVPSVFFGDELPLSWSSRTDDGSIHYSVAVRHGQLALITIFAIVLGFAWGWIINHDAFLKLLRKLGLTQRTSRSSVWSDVFHMLGGNVQVVFEDGRMLRGWIRCYSDEPEDSTLFLEAAAWIDESQEEYPIDGPGILVTKQSGIRYVMFLNEIYAAQQIREN